MLFDGGFSEHWPDALVAAFIACMGWLLKRDISAMDKRHERAEDKFETQGSTLGKHETRITVLEVKNGIHRSDD